MTPVRLLLAAAVGVAVASGPLLTASASAQSRWDRDGAFDGRGGYGLRGRGVRLLEPELRETARGRAFVLRDFDFNHDGRVSPDEAIAANRAFREDARDGRRAGDRDGSDDRFAPPPPPPPPMTQPAPPPAPPAADREWDRGAMRDYHFRQGRYGATFTMSDVLFETGSARLRPGSETRLGALAGYLRANPSVRLRIDGYTDSVGTAASNLQLSRARARSVADALVAQGAEGRDFALEGHGETSPVSTNATATGRQLNRRVEVTLVGQQASSFN